MSVQFNHTIVLASDRDRSARFLADILGRPVPTRFGPFAVVELDNGVDKRRITSGFQGLARRGQPIEVRPILEARNIVQWWIYYPGVLNVDDLALTPAEAASLNESLTAYRAGDLRRALEMFPGQRSG